MVQPHTVNKGKLPHLGQLSVPQPPPHCVSTLLAAGHLLNGLEAEAVSLELVGEARGGGGELLCHKPVGRDLDDPAGSRDMSPGIIRYKTPLNRWVFRSYHTQELSSKGTRPRHQTCLHESYQMPSENWAQSKLCCGVKFGQR